MDFRLIALAALLAAPSQGCYRPMYAQPYGYSTPGYPMNSYPGAIQTQTPGPMYVPGSTTPGMLPPASGGYNPGPSSAPPPTFAPGGPGGLGPSATRPVPMYPEAPQPAGGNFEAPDTTGGRELGYGPMGGGIQPAGAALPPGSIPPGQPGLMPQAQAAPIPAAAPGPAAFPDQFGGDAFSSPSVTADSFEGNNEGPTTFQ